MLGADLAPGAIDVPDDEVELHGPQTHDGPDFRHDVKYDSLGRKYAIDDTGCRLSSRSGGAHHAALLERNREADTKQMLPFRHCRDGGDRTSMRVFAC